MPQEKHDKYKAEADARAKALADEADQLRVKVTEAEKEIAGLRQAERSAKDAAEADMQQLRGESARLQVRPPPPSCERLQCLPALRTGLAMHGLTFPAHDSHGPVTYVHRHSICSASKST